MKRPHIPLPFASIWGLTALVCLPFLFASHGGMCDADQDKGNSVKTGSRKTPVLEWTAGRDAMNFRYDFLEKIKTTTLLKATPETGPWNHHPYVFYLKGVLFALWDTQARDENASGQHGVMRRSMDLGETWLPMETLFPPLAENVPAATPSPSTRFQTSYGLIVVDNTIYAVTDVAEWQRPDACARSNAGRLPDGQFFVINNVLPISTKKGGRSLLAISLSRDGLNFDRVAALRFVAPAPRYEGRSKSIGYAYPHSTIVGEHLWVIYSVNKEDIEVARIPLNRLYEIKTQLRGPK